MICMVSLGVFFLLSVICTLTFKLHSRWNPTKFGYAQANFPNPPQPPARRGIFSSFARRPVSEVNEQ